MLESTFCHIPCIGEVTERRLWNRGCRTWDNLLENDYNLPKDTYRRMRAGILESKARLSILDHEYFKEKLPRNQSWRAYESFKDHACYLDIETTGLSPGADIVTTVCLHAPDNTRNYVSGDNMHELSRDLNEYKYIVTFNGARFDLPFLNRCLGIRFPQIHLDLMYPLRTIGHHGGLKKIENQLGYSRETEGVTGFDAVRLWNAYKTGRECEVAGRRVKGADALRLLVDYNREDTVNLETLADYTVGKLRELHEIKA